MRLHLNYDRSRPKTVDDDHETVLKLLIQCRSSSWLNQYFIYIALSLVLGKGFFKMYIIFHIFAVIIALLTNITKNLRAVAAVYMQLLLYDLVIINYQK